MKGHLRQRGRKLFWNFENASSTGAKTGGLPDYAPVILQYGFEGQFILEKKNMENHSLRLSRQQELKTKREMDPITVSRDRFNFNPALRLHERLFCEFRSAVWAMRGSCEHELKRSVFSEHVRDDEVERYF